MTSSWMLVAGFFFAAMALLVKLGGAHFESIELGFYRSLGAFLFIAAFVLAKRERVWNPHMATHFFRSMAGTFGIITYFYAIANLPLATATTLNYTSPLFLAIGTTIVLGEKFSRWLLAAIVLGFAGVAMLLQPTFAAGKEGPAMVGLFSGLVASWAYLGVRALSRQGEPEWRILFWFGFFGTVGCAAWQLAFSTFHPVTWDNVGVLLGIGVLGTLAQLAMTRAYRTGNTLVVGSLSYSTIVFSTLFMVTIWDDRLSVAGWAGIVVIVASGLMALRVEKKEQVGEPDLKAELLVTTDALAAHLDDPDWIVFDTRHDLSYPDKGWKAWQAAHIPGAYFMHMDEDLSGKKTGRNGRHPLPDLADFAFRMNRCGVAPGRQVVVYDDGGASFAVRLWWMLRWLGHDRVALLDGGLAAWKREGRPLDAAVPAPREGKFVPAPAKGATVDAQYVAASLGNPSVNLIDARAATRFLGENETLDPVAGHIPGSHNRFWQHNLGHDGRFLAPEELHAEFIEVLGDADPALVVHSCGSGVTACHNLFAMELAGLAGSRLYPGSWSEWCSDPSRPVATGPK